MHMKLGFVTCVQLGLSCMETLYAAGARLDLAVTLQDQRARQKSGRVFIDDFCAARRIPLLKIDHINDAAVKQAVVDRRIDWLFIVGWSQIAGRAVLEAPTRGALGIHPTLLPEGRGRAAIPWAILKRLPETGVTLFKLDERIDAGPIVSQRRIPLSPRSDASWLYDEVNRAHMDLIRDVCLQFRDGTLRLNVQDEACATVWPGRRPEDGRIDLEGSVHDAECLVRAVTRPYPGAFVERGGQRVVIWKARVRSEAAGRPGCQFRDGYLEFLDYDGVA